MLTGLDTDISLHSLNGTAHLILFADILELQIVYLQVMLETLIPLLVSNQLP